MNTNDNMGQGIRILSLGEYIFAAFAHPGMHLYSILASDNGGPGTYPQLLIIKEYVTRLAKDLGVDENDLYPADYFELMGGVGFGGCVE